MTRPAQTANGGLNTRRAALEALAAVDEGAWSATAVNRAVETIPDARDRRFAAHLVYETLRWHGSLETALTRVSSRPLAQIEPALHNILRIGATQLLVSRVPARAAVDTAVTLAKQQVPASRRNAAGGFVNGILRAIARNGPGFAWLIDPNMDASTRLGILTGHPRWIVDAVRARYDDTAAEAFLHANNTSPGVTLRAIGARDAVLDALRAKGVACEPGTHPQAIRTTQFDPSRDGFIEDGTVVVQDEASMRVVDALDVSPGQHVLDLCAGPGGKALDIAERLGADGQLVAVELHAHRAALIESLADRLNFPVDVRVGDATNPPLNDEQFDRVLVDAPCSGLGTSRRRPEVRWRKHASDVAALHDLQVKLLEAGWTHTKPGGLLTYAVCTYTTDETVAVRDQFETAHPDARCITTHQLLPHIDDTDGMYYATWQKPASQ